MWDMFARRVVVGSVVALALGVSACTSGSGGTTPAPSGPLSGSEVPVGLPEPGSCEAVTEAMILDATGVDPGPVDVQDPGLCIYSWDGYQSGILVFAGPESDLPAFDPDAQLEYVDIAAELPGIDRAFYTTFNNGLCYLGVAKSGQGYLLQLNTSDVSQYSPEEFVELARSAAEALTP